MASQEKDLEDQILEVGNRLVSPPSAGDELLALLDQTESLLSRVAQSPSQSVSAALRPALKALVAKELLEHSDIDVKVAVASCASEITRITAPDAPYDDNLMKVIFQMIVESFGKLDDISSRSYSKRVSILETVAKVRSCVVMLDLECDAMILEMFQHFLNTISSNHPEKVFSLMETVMTLVLEESEDISSDLLSCLLDSVKKDGKEIPPMARTLGEKVIGNCAVKLKPYLMKVVQSLCAREYSNIVASICQENSDQLEQNEITISEEILANDKKLSERTVSDELPQESAKLEQEVGSPVKVCTVDTSSKLVVENGNIQRENGDSVVEPAPPKQKPEHALSSGQSKNNVAAEISDSDNLKSMDVKSDGTLDLKPKKARGRKSSSSVQMTDAADHSRNNSDKSDPSLPSKRKGHSKEVDGSQLDGPSGKEVESAIVLEPEEKIEREEKIDQPHYRPDNEGATCVSPQKPSDIILNAPRGKRGRPSGSKVSAKSALNTIADRSVITSGLRSEDNDFKKEPQAVNNSEGKSPISEGKSLRRFGKKVQTENAADGETPVSAKSDPEAKPTGKSRRKGSKKKITPGKSSGKIKPPKGKVTLDKDAAGELILRDDPSSPKYVTEAQRKDQCQLEDGVKTQSGGKRARGTEEIPKAPDHKTELDENLVGSRIRVWWPDDKRFYGGTVEEFSPTSRKHKIVYEDGEIEELVLKDERYEIDNTPSEVPRNKKAKATSESSPEQAMTETPLKSGTESGSVKRRGRPKGRPSTGSRSLSNDSSKASKKSKVKAARKSKDDTPSKPKGPGNKSEDDTSDIGTKDDAPKSDGKSKGETPKSGRNPKGRGNKFKDDTSDIGTKDDAPKSGGKPKGETPKSGRKSKGGTPKTGSKLKDEIPKVVSKSEDDTSDIGTKDESPKSGGKPKGKTPKSGRKSKGNTLKTGKKSKDEIPKMVSKSDDDTLDIGTKDETPKSVKGEPPKSGRKSKGDTPVGRKSKDETPKMVSKPEDDTPDISTKDDTAKGGGKPKSETPKSGRKSKNETPKMVSKLEESPKSTSKSKNDGREPRPRGRPPNSKNTPKSKEVTPRVGRKSKLEGGATPKTDGESSAGGASEKGKAMTPESGTSAKAQGSGGRTGKKRKRKVRK